MNGEAVVGVFFRALLVLLPIGLGVFWWVTRPGSIDQAAIASLDSDAARGEQVFNAAGCASCHAAPGAEGADKLILAGGLAFPSDFGIFYAPNISPSAAGLGGWSAADLARAMIKGVSPEGTHYYPAFPYGSYARTGLQDVVDLKAYMDTLPPTDAANRPHDVGFPFAWRRLLGGWKFLFLTDEWQMAANTAEEERGRYLVEALGHCTECHTSRNLLGGLRRGLWMAGGPNPEGKGRIPNITPDDSGIGAWSADEIAEYLASGFTPDFDVAGGAMTDVIANISKLPPKDHRAIAAYLKRLPPLPAVPGH